MIDYTGVKCPVCERPFLKGDDIVVCPECGAPYHRSCYKKVGKCIYTDKHEAGEYWEPQKVEAPDHSKEEKNKKCPQCGTMNAKTALFCEQCGTSLTGNPERGARNRSPYSPFGGTPYPPNGQQPPTGPGNIPPYGGYPGGPSEGPNGPFPPGMGGQQIPVMFDPLGGINPQDTIEDVSAGDLAKLVQNNTPYYIPTFLFWKRFRRGRFNFCSFLFSGAWMLYRKMYKFGAIVTAIMVALYFCNLIVTNNLFTPLLEELFQEAGIALDSVTVTMEQIQQVQILLLQRPATDLFILCLPTLIWLVQLAVMLFCGIQGNKMYCNFCLNKVKKIRSSVSEEKQVAEQLQTQGGVNTSIAICFLICYLLVMWFPRLLF